MRKSALFLPLVSLLCTVSASAALPAFTLNTLSSVANGDFYIGYEFSVSSPQVVSALGVIDAINSGSLTTNIGVGLYRKPATGSVATHIASVIVPSGTASESIGARGAFFANITPVTLAAGNYVILADAGSGGKGYGRAAFTFRSGISYVQGWFAGSTANFPGLGVDATLTNASNSGDWASAVFKVGDVGSLTSTLTQQRLDNVNLTALGSTDWAVWGLNTNNSLTPNVRKSGGTAISNLTDVSAGSPLRAIGQFGQVGQSTFDWTDGPPVTTSCGLFTCTVPGSATGALTGLQHDNTTSKINEGFSFTVPASQTAQRVGVYYTTHTGISTITATLSDNSATPISRVFNANQVDNVSNLFVVDFAAGLPSQTLTITIKLTTSTFNNSNVAIQAVYLSPPSTPVSITTSTLPGGTAGSPYSQQITTSGGSTPFTWTASGLPGGLSINQSGVIAGTPTAAGTFSVTVGVTDSVSSTNSKTLSLSVAAPPVSILTTSLPSGQAGKAYTATTLSASGGFGTFTWSATGLPFGLTLSPAGVLSGTPGTAGNSTVTVQVRDSLNTTATKALALTIVAPPVSILTSTLPGGKTGQQYGPASLAATGGSGVFTWSASGLPQGLSISGAGVISGVPVNAGTTGVTVSAFDSILGTTTTTNLSITIVAGLPVLTGPSSLGNVPVGGAVSGAFTVSGGAAPYRWTLSGAPGLTIDGNGVVSGAVQSAGAFTVQVLVTDAANNSAGAAATLTVLGITTSSLPPAQTIANYSATVMANGGVPPYTYAITGLPGGLTSSGGEITGRPFAAGSSTVTAKVTDSRGLTVSASYTLTVTGAGPLSLATTSAPGGSVGQPYSQGLAVVGGNPPYTLSLTGGALPAGLSLSGSGTVAGVPTVAGATSFGVRVTDSTGGQVLGSVAISIEPEPLRITTGTLPAAYVGVEYPGQTLAASGGVPPYTFSAKGNLPAGLTLANGLVAGVPTAAGNSNFNVTVTDSAATPVSATTSLAISVQQSGGDLVLSAGSVAFAMAAGSTEVPAPAYVAVSSTSPAQVLGYSVAVAPAAPWLSVTTGNSTPGTLTMGLTPAALALAAGAPNATSVVVTCTTGACQGKSQTIGVVLNVTAPPPQLSVGSALISLTASTSNPVAAVATLRVQNSGGGQLSGVTISTDANWLKVGSVPGSLAPGPGAQVEITASPTGLKAGYYRATITVSSAAGTAKVPVALLLSGDSVMTLGPAGAQFTMAEGGAVGKSTGSFLVSVNSSSPVTYSAAVQPGSPWLVVNAGNGNASSTGPGTVNFSISASEAATLKAGAYYGTVRVSANGIVNAPLDYQVVLNVTPGNVPAQPEPQPAGLLFLTAAGGGQVTPQLVTLYAGSRTPVGFQIAANTADGGAWLSAATSASTTSAGAPAQVSVSVNSTGLKAGVYRGGVNVSYTGTAVRTVNVTLVVQPSAGAGLMGEQVTRLSPRAGPSCAGGQLVVAQTGLVSSFAAPASWPTPLAIRLVDSCGSLVPEGQAVATFSNGDPPLALTMVDSRQALYTATWTPRKTTQQVTINARVTAAGYTPVTSQILGQVVPNEAPSLEPNGTQDVFNPLVGGSLGPGNIVQIYGSRLASTKNSPATLPLPTTVFGTKVLIGGVLAPLFFVSPGQINAQIPVELTGGRQYQVVVSANGALTTPQPIQLNQGTPATLQFTSGLIVAQHGDGGLINETAPAKPGEGIVFYMSGLGATDIEVPSGAAAPSDPPARVKDVPKVTLNGSAVPVAFAGLTPGLSGLYQVNIQVPNDLADGTYTVEVSQAEATGNQTSLIVKK